MTTAWTPAEFEQQLRSLGRYYHIHHPFQQMMYEGKLNAAQLRGWVANRFYYQVTIPRKDAALLFNCPDREVRRVWIQRILDHDGGPATDHIAACLSEGGTLVNYGLMSGQPCQVSAASFVFRDVTLRGFWLAKWFQKATPAEQMKVFGELTQLIASGKLKARIAATYSVAQIKEAVAAAASGERDGKILIVP